MLFRSLQTCPFLSAHRRFRLLTASVPPRHCSVPPFHFDPFLSAHRRFRLLTASAPPRHAFYGDDASVHPGSMSELMLYETAVAWIRARETTSRPATPWKETPEEFSTRLRAICQDINSRLDIEGLCRDLPSRVQQLVDAKGGRINK